MASRTSDKKRTLRNRSMTCTRSMARQMKYASPDLDIPALERELVVRRTFGGLR